MTSHERQVSSHVAAVRACRLCPDVMPPPVVVGVPRARIYLVGQAPGTNEREKQRNFCGGSGRTLFRWFASIGVEEQTFRERVYMAAVLRCFPGKNDGRDGDRRPAPAEIERCRQHMDQELDLLKPELVLLVGKLAIDLFLPRTKLVDVVGRTFPFEHNGHGCMGLPLPHPSGLSRWTQKDPGKSLLEEALSLLKKHSTWQSVFGHPIPPQ